MSTLEVHVDGIGLWSSRWPDFGALRNELRDGQVGSSPTPLPPALRLPAKDRRRASESVLLAIEVAAQAIAMSGHDASQLSCVFASAHGDHVITDYMCTTLAHSPTELSPTRFHNSVHNAPVGYWTIAMNCQAPSTALCAGRETFANALLEASVQVQAEQRPALLFCGDIAGSGALNELTGCEQTFGSALVLAPRRSEYTLATLQCRVAKGSCSDKRTTQLTDRLDSNASALALPLLTQLASEGGRTTLALAPAMHLDIQMEMLS